MAARTKLRQTSRWVLWSFLVNIALVFSPSESADLLSQCPPQVPRTHYLKAAEWGKCYEFHMEERTWRQANTICSTKGGHLVTIKEERVQKFLIKTLTELRWPRNGLWIGATDKEKEMEWRWVTGERVKDGYSKWASGQPSCGILCFEDCAVMRWKERSGEWHDYRCNWLEDYSSICEYDIPEPTTTTTTTTMTSSSQSTTTNATTAGAILTNSSSYFSAKMLESEYLVHGKRHSEKEEKNSSDVVSLPAVIEQGVNTARAEQVQEVPSSSSGLGSGGLASLVIVILAILAGGLCFVFLFIRRRRKEIREDDPGISYENPYYEETKPSLNNRNNDDTDTDGDTSIHGDDADFGKADAAVGLTASTAKKVVEIKQSRPRMMNNYDTPPARTVTLPVRTSKQNSYSNGQVEFKPVTKGVDQAVALPKPNETSSQYEEFPDNGHISYDVPRASRYQHYEDDTDELPEDEQTYYNSYNENIYESVGDLPGIMEQEGPSLAEELYAQKVKDDERYVPFMFDGPSKS